MTYIIEFKDGKWLRVTQEQGEKIKQFVEEEKKWFEINDSMYFISQITKIEKDR